MLVVLKKKRKELSGRTWAGRTIRTKEHASSIQAHAFRTECQLKTKKHIHCWERSNQAPIGGFSCIPVHLVVDRELDVVIGQSRLGRLLESFWFRIVSLRIDSECAVLHSFTTPN